MTSLPQVTNELTYPGRRALILRAGPWTATPAVSRTAGSLAELGYTITVLAWDRTCTKPAEEYQDGWRICWFRRSYRAGSPIFFVLWVPWWLWVVRQLVNVRYEIVHAMNLECVLPCIMARPFRRFKLVYDIRDAWGQMFSKSRRVAARLFQLCDRWAAKHVDGMLLSQGRLDVMARFFGGGVCGRTPVVQVLNVPEKDVAGKYLPPDQHGIRINFSGHISYARNARALIELASRRPDVIVDVVGEVRDETLRLEMDALPNFRLHGRVGLGEAMDVMRQANLVMVAYDASTEIAVVSSANKMFEAMMMSRPYIGSIGAYPGVIAERFGAGWALPYGDSDALIRLVDTLAGTPVLIGEAARRGRDAYESHFRWEQQKANLQSLYRFLSGPGGVPTRAYDGWKILIGDCQDAFAESIQDSPAERWCTER